MRDDLYKELLKNMIEIDEEEPNKDLETEKFYKSVLKKSSMKPLEEDFYVFEDKLPKYFFNIICIEIDEISGLDNIELPKFYYKTKEKNNLRELFDELFEEKDKISLTNLVEIILDIYIENLTIDKKPPSKNGLLENYKKFLDMIGGRKNYGNEKGIIYYTKEQAKLALFFIVMAHEKNSFINKLILNSQIENIDSMEFFTFERYLKEYLFKYTKLLDYENTIVNRFKPLVLNPVLESRIFINKKLNGLYDDLQILYNNIQNENNLENLIADLKDIEEIIEDDIADIRVKLMPFVEPLRYKKVETRYFKIVEELVSTEK